MKNYSLFENGQGGQLFLQNNNIQKTNALGVICYIKMFGGNRKASTVKNNKVGEKREDWWGNDSTKAKSTWINSETERFLTGMVMTTASLISLEEVILRDLDAVKKYGDISVDISYPGANRVQILITVTQLDSNEEISVVWDATKNEVVTYKTI